MSKLWLKRLARCPLFALVAALVWLTGCATMKIDWAARVGNYTYDQAVLDLGPPDKQAKLQNGTVVAEWLTQRGFRYGFATPTYYGGPYGYCNAPFYSTYTETYSPNYYLRLTFGPDGKLQAWEKLAR